MSIRDRGVQGGVGEDVGVLGEPADRAAAQHVAVKGEVRGDPLHRAAGTVEQ